MEKRNKNTAEEQLLIENAGLRMRLNEAEETLNAIRNGEVDAVLVSGSFGEKIFSLTSAETSYRIIIEEMNEGAATLMGDGTILYCNNRFSELISVPLEQTIGANFTQFVLEQDKDKFLMLLRSGIYEKVKGEISFLTSGGTVCHFQCSLSPLPPAVLGDVCLIASDITALKNKEAELQIVNDTLEQRVAARSAELIEKITELKSAEVTIKESRERYRKAQEVGHIGSWESDLQNSTFWGSDEGKKLFGLNPEADVFTEKIVMDCVVQKDRVNQAMIDLIEKNIPYNIVFDIIPLNSTEKITINSIAELIRDQNGHPVKITGVLHDITEHKKAEAEIERKNKELVRTNAEKDKLFSVIAHDLRNPFNSFLGFTQIMAEELPSLTLNQIQEMAVKMRKSASKLYALLENLLEWSLLQRKLTTFEPSKMLLLPKISECVQLVLEPTIQKNIKVRVDIPETFEVFADKNMIGGILRNLISNAVKFTAYGGEITIKAQLLIENKIQISVQDTGIGMSKKMMKNLFHLDGNSNRKGTENEPSTGLGLVICKDFVEKHGGNLWVESEAGRGSTFHFTLPGEKLRKEHKNS
jgi:PAS domain S-box-containing protein